MRLDRWLWAARFAATRSLAQAAVVGGRVKFKGERVGAANTLAPGAQPTIRAGELECSVTPDCLSARPAAGWGNAWGRCRGALRARRVPASALRLEAGIAPDPQGAFRRASPLKRTSTRDRWHRYARAACQKGLLFVLDPVDQPPTTVLDTFVVSTALVNLVVPLVWVTPTV